MRTIYWGLMALPLLTGCSHKQYDEKHAMTYSVDIEECVDSTFAHSLSSDDYDYQCKDKSVDTVGFVVSQDDGLVVSTEDPETHHDYESYTFEVEPGDDGLPDLNNEDKVRVRGVFDSRSWGGTARVAVAKVERATLSGEDIEMRHYSIINNRQHDKEDRDLMVYLDCAQTFEASHPGTQCPRPTSGVGLGMGMDGDQFQVQGICFFGKRAITFECEGSGNNDATITKTTIVSKGL